MMSHMSHMKSITQINHTIESHKMGHDWDDIMHKIRKSWLPGIMEVWIIETGKYAQKLLTYWEIMTLFVAPEQLWC